MKSLLIHIALIFILIASSSLSFAENRWPSDIQIHPLSTQMAQAILIDPENASTNIDNAITTSGFYIKKTPNSQAMNMGQEINFDGWQVELLKLAQKNGIKIELDQYILSWQMAGDAAHGPIPKQSVLDPIFREKFIEALRTVALNDEYDKSGLNIMVGLVVALGRENTDSPYDLLDTNVSGKVQLDALQVALLSQRITAELYAQALTGKAQKNNPKAKTQLRLQDKDNVPCTMTNIEGMLMDSIAASSGALLGGVQFAGGILDKLKDMKFINDVGLEKYSNMATAANMAANYIKLLWTMAAFRSEMKSDVNPLERTKTKIAGKDANLEAKFWLDIGNAQIINCIRPALNSVGLDFSLPQDGPLAKTNVEWEIKTKVGGDNDIIETVGSDPMKQTTDDNGISKIKIQGKAQKKDLTKKLIRVEKNVKIIATTNLKPNNIKQDLIDLAGGLGGVSALGSLPVEMLNRIPFLFIAKMNLKVIDWKEMEGDLFMIEGVYHEKKKSSILYSIDKLEDKIFFGVEIKIVPRGTSTGTITSFIDDDAKYDLKYESNISTGEGCSGTQTPTGKQDAFTYIPNSGKVNVFYNPGWPTNIPKPPSMPDIKEETKVNIMIKGNSERLGWKYTSDYPSCKMTDIPSSQKSLQLNLAFSSLDFQNGNKEFYIDNRDQDGFGWAFKISLLENK